MSQKNNHRLVEVPQEWISTEGSGSRVLVCDSGCDETHEAIRNNIVEYKSFFPTGKKILSGAHATHVSGIITSTAPECSLLIGQAMGLSIGKLEYLEKALRWGLDQDVDVVNLSLSYSMNKVKIKELIDEFNARGAIVVCAQGWYPNRYPACFDSTISVGAYGSVVVGPQVELFAPKTFLSSVPINEYKEKSGHSMSASYVSGIACLAKAYDKTMSKDDFIHSLR